MRGWTMLGGLLILLAAPPPGAVAQAWGDRPLLAGGYPMALTINGEEFLAGFDPRSAGTPDPYAPMLDMRRRIIANAWARSATISGPANAQWAMSHDLFRENGANCPYSTWTCAATPVAERDRLEVYAGWDYASPEDTVVGDAFNRTSGVRDTLALPPAGSDSMLFPGMHFRFFSGPGVVYPGTPTTRWQFMPDPRPIGEGTGFLTDYLTLTPSVPAARGHTFPLTLAAYERATIALVGGSGPHDSVAFYVDPAVTRPTIAAWTQGIAGAYLYARCGAMPTQSTYDTWIYVNDQGAVLDLTAGCPGSYWRVVAVNASTAARVMHVRVGASTSAARVFDLVVGTEVAGDAGEIAYVQRVMRQASWRFYGATGGTHIIRSWVTQNDECYGVHVCFRNRATCSPPAITHTTGWTPSLAVDICRNIAGFTASNPEHVSDALLMTHEFGHLLTANGSLNQLGDEYWIPNPVAQICGRDGPGYSVSQCAHSIMANTAFWRRIGSLCVPGSHSRVRQVLEQPSSTATNLVIRGSRSVAGGTSITTTPTECWDGVTTNFAGGGGSAAWQVLANTGAAPLAHPVWSPDNHQYVNFADGPSIAVGRIL